MKVLNIYKRVINQPKEKMAEFKFSEPEGFNGIHKFEITALDAQRTEIKHTIDMKTSIKATFIWYLAVRWLYDAYIEDAFDKIENQFSNVKNEYKWNIWVWFLRGALNEYPSV